MEGSTLSMQGCIEPVTLKRATRKRLLMENALRDWLLVVLCILLLLSERKKPPDKYKTLDSCNIKTELSFCVLPMRIHCA